MGIYEEQAEVCRRIVPYQNVSVRKEELEIRIEGNPEIVQAENTQKA